MSKLHLPDGHLLRSFPDDFKLYQLVVEHLQRAKVGHFIDLTTWTYATAEAHGISTECVSKVLTAVRKYEGLGRW
jgi:hypothetical protein